MARADDERRWVEVVLPDEPKLVARVWDGPGQVVLLLHGLGHNLEVWSPLAGTLPRQCRPVALDLRGHGRSGTSPHNSYEDFDLDVVRLLDALSVDRAFLVGHSWGARVALHFAATHGERCLGVIALDQALWDYTPPGHYLSSDLGELPRMETPTLSDDVAAAIVDEAAEWGTWLAVVERSLSRSDRGWEQSPAPSVIQSVTLSEARAQPVEGLYDRITCPMVMLFASDDEDFGFAPAVGRASNVEHLRSTVDAAIVWVEGDHNFHVEQPEVVSNAVVKYLAGGSK